MDNEKWEEPDLGASSTICMSLAKNILAKFLYAVGQGALGETWMDISRKGYLHFIVVEEAVS